MCTLYSMDVGME